MPAFQQVRRVHHSADEMFDLVADVERYHEFVPLCLRHAIVSREVRPDSEILMTDMTVECGIYRESYISRVALDRANGRFWSSRRMDRCVNCEPNGHFSRELIAVARLGSIYITSLQARLWRC